MTLFSVVKAMHLLSAAVSLGGFALRGWWMWHDSPQLNHRLTRTLPHIVDTLLLASAIGLALMSRQYPLDAPWLTAKVVALCFYIVFGSIALKRGRTRRIRGWALAGALVTFGYIVAVALFRSPWPFGLG